jgi:glycosyltransferase involved in cell wall biosynthesis
MEHQRVGNIDISVVIPVFEEEDSIGSLVREVFGQLETEESEFEVILVDDGSKDRTIQVLQDLKRTYRDRLVVARHLINRGNGAALRTGFNVACGNIVVSMDADGQHSPADISKIAALIPPHDLVIGARMKDYEGSWYRNLANKFYNRFASWLSRVEIKDLTSGFRAMRREAVEHFLPLFPNGFSAPTTTTLAFIKAGYSVAFLPIYVRQREAGSSKIKLFQDGSRFLMIIVRMIMLYDPLRIFIPIGMSLFGLGFLAWIAGLLNANRLVFPNSTIFLFSSAILIFLMGLLSDQLANTRIGYYGDENVEFLE